MYTAAREFINPVHGRIKKGRDVSALWDVATLDVMVAAGLLEKVETKPEPEAKKDTKRRGSLKKPTK